MNARTSPVGDLLREWRAIQGMSQLDLALAAEVSSRHVSFIETGRSEPSRNMVLRLAETLEVPLRERNAMLTAAGFAPLYRESRLQDTDVRPVRRALELVLRSHDPFPAFVLDPSWNILRSNRSYELLLSMSLPERGGTSVPENVIRLCFDPDLLRPRIVNWELAAHVLGHRLPRQLRRPSIDPERKRLFEELLAYAGVEEAMAGVESPPDAAVVIPLQLELHGRRLSWFSTIATIGTPQDITLEELCIESMFPADDETDAAVRELMRGAAAQPSSRSKV
jgi:transcriptional regulator with XRE-family HTH domain